MPKQKSRRVQIAQRCEPKGGVRTKWRYQIRAVSLYLLIQDNRRSSVGRQVRDRRKTWVHIDPLLFHPIVLVPVPPDIVSILDHLAAGQQQSENA